MAGVSTSTAAVFPSPVPSGIASPTAQAAGLRNKATKEGLVWAGSLCVPSVSGDLLERLYMGHDVFTVCFSYNTDLRIPLLVISVYRSQNEEEVCHHSVILLCLHYHGSCGAFQLTTAHTLPI